jgi:hypothetical protein
MRADTKVANLDTPMVGLMVQPMVGKREQMLVVTKEKLKAVL